MKSFMASEVRETVREMDKLVPHLRYARPGVYILFALYIPCEEANPDCMDGTYINAYYLGGNPVDTVVHQLGIRDDTDVYAIAWCPSRNQAQKSAIKNWSK